MSASAVTVFHRGADSAALDGWLPELLASAASAEGYLEGAISVHDAPELDPAVSVTFSNERRLHQWLDSEPRAAVLRDGQARGCWPRTPDLVVVASRNPPTGVGVFRHPVSAERQADFRASQLRLAAASSKHPGYEGNVVFPADRSGQTVTVVRFRTGAQLVNWLRSTARAQALPQLRSNLKRNFKQDPYIAPFGATIRTEDGQTEITPGWKVAMLVLLVVYPTVMLLSRFETPVLVRLGSPIWFTVWLNNVVATATLQWVSIPLSWFAFRRWMDPVDGRGWRIGVIGAGALIVLYVLTMLVFATIRQLQY
jgi:antibiotic biosynthesis monooxygenase (ABM) superfamily enzyme